MKVIRQVAEAIILEKFSKLAWVGLYS